MIGLTILEFVVPIPGTKRRRHLDDNAAGLDVTLTAEDLRRIEETAPKGAFAGERYANMAPIRGITPLKRS